VAETRPARVLSVRVAASPTEGEAAPPLAVVVVGDAGPVVVGEVGSVVAGSDVGVEPLGAAAAPVVPAVNGSPTRPAAANPTPTAAAAKTAHRATSIARLSMTPSLAAPGLTDR
jgi:hypothetical protein